MDICVALISYIHVTMHYPTTVHPTHMARIVPTILLHFLHPWRSDVGSVENARSNFQPWTYALHAPATLVHPCTSTQIKNNLFCSNGRVGTLFCPRIGWPFRVGKKACPPYETSSKTRSNTFHHRGTEGTEKTFLLLTAPMALLTK